MDDGVPRRFPSRVPQLLLIEDSDSQDDDSCEDRYQQREDQCELDECLAAITGLWPSAPKDSASLSKH